MATSKQIVKKAGQPTPPKYTWDADAEITLKGIEFDKIYNEIKNQLREELESENFDYQPRGNFQKNISLYESSIALDQVFTREVEKGTIKKG